MRRSSWSITTGKRRMVLRNAWVVLIPLATIVAIGNNPASAYPIKHATSATIGTAPTPKLVPRLSVTAVSQTVSVDRGVRYPLTELITVNNASSGATFSLSQPDGPSTMRFWYRGSGNRSMLGDSQLAYLASISVSTDGSGPFTIDVSDGDQHASLDLYLQVRVPSATIGTAPTLTLVPRLSPPSGPTTPKASAVPNSSVVIPATVATPSTAAVTTSTVVPPTTALSTPPTTAANLAPTATVTNLIAQSGVASPVVLQGTDPENKPLTTALVRLPIHGKLTGQTPNLVYIPDPGFVGADAFTFTVNDGQMTSGQAVVTVAVVSAKAATKPRAKRNCRVVKGRKICTR